MSGRRDKPTIYDSWHLVFPLILFAPVSLLSPYLTQSFVCPCSKPLSSFLPFRSHLTPVFPPWFTPCRWKMRLLEVWISSKLSTTCLDSRSSSISPRGPRSTWEILLSGTRLKRHEYYTNTDMCFWGRKTFSLWIFFPCLQYFFMHRLLNFLAVTSQLFEFLRSVVFTWLVWSVLLSVCLSELGGGSEQVCRGDWTDLETQSWWRSLLWT